MSGSVEPLVREDSDLASRNPLVEGLERLPVRPTTLVMFGGTGDLAHRKLPPALYDLAHDGALPERFRLVGVARADHPHEDFRQIARECLIGNRWSGYPPQTCSAEPVAS
jgi:glucose-6-phosphate 1-dehydrogenase